MIYSPEPFKYMPLVRERQPSKQTRARWQDIQWQAKRHRWPRTRTGLAPDHTGQPGHHPLTCPFRSGRYVKAARMPWRISGGHVPAQSSGTTSARYVPQPSGHHRNGQKTSRKSSSQVKSSCVECTGKSQYASCTLSAPVAVRYCL